VRRAALLLTPLLLAMIVTTMVPWSAQAIESFGIGAVPANPRADNPRTQSIFIIEAKPGSRTDDAIQVINNSTETKTIAIYAVDSQKSSDGAFACAQAADERKSVGSWIALEKNQITLEPRTNETIPFAVTIPPNAEVGEHNGCIAIQDTSPAAQSSHNGVVLSFRSALRVVVTVPGQVSAKLRLLGVKTQEASSQKLRVTPVVQNDGNVSVDAEFDVELLDIFGATRASGGGQFPVLTKTKSQFNFELDKPFWGGWYREVVEAKYSQLSATGKTGKQDVLTSKPNWIYIAPQPAALGIEAGSAMLIAGGSGLFVWRRKQHQLALLRTKQYKVKRGENIQSIAEVHGIDWRRLAKLNGLKAPYTVKPKQTLRVPSAKQPVPSEQSRGKKE